MGRTDVAYQRVQKKKQGGNDAALINNLKRFACAICWRITDCARGFAYSS
jgi:hypothetical protein